ncbi:MAG: glycosyltransferase [Deltaproteobacteria bacterium]|nr:MAG: glycosyltransferase [Deltaproteobacteria bacterium]
MNIVFFTNNFFPRVSGVAVSIDFLCRALNELGHRTLVFAPDYVNNNDREDKFIYRAKSLNIIPSWLSVPLPMFDHTKIINSLIEFNPDVVHVHHPFLMGKTGMRLAHSNNIPLVFTYHTLYYEYLLNYFSSNSQVFEKAIYKRIADFSNQCNLVIAPTKQIKQYLSHFGVETQIEVVPTGIDLHIFNKDYQPSELDKIRSELKINSSDKVLLFVGRMAREKNVSLLLEALKEILKRFVNLVLLMVGKGVQIRKLQREAARLNIDKNVIWMGFQERNRLPLLYKLADLFLFPSVTDTQGIVLYEALAASIPIIAVRSLAAETIVDDRKNGLLSDDDPQDFAEKVTFALENLDSFEINFSLEEFSSYTVGNKVSKLYERLM